MQKKVMIVGAGFSGAVIARELAEKAGIQCTVIDSRDHIGGNCHTERDEETNIMVHRYGPHIFHTNKEEIWDYIQKFGEFKPFINRVKASIHEGVFSLPINLHTINQFFGTRLSPNEAKDFLKEQGDDSIGDPANFEEQAMKMIGKDLYEAFFKGYTQKQWGCSPKDLPASILKRLPVRFNYDDNYYSDPYQGIPLDGYTKVIERILNHPLITIRLSTDWDRSMSENYDHVFFSGPLDEFFDHKHGRLAYRTVFWERKMMDGDFQGNAVINYCAEDVVHTRIHEHKHFAPWEEHKKTLVFTEYSKETEVGDVPYYPKRMTHDKDLLKAYVSEAMGQEGVSFIGRLATYRYMDMHHVIGEALDFADEWITEVSQGRTAPVFPAGSVSEEV